MKINFEQTAIKCRMINQAEVARQCGVTPPMVNAIIKGTYSPMVGERAQRVIGMLRDIGFLVEEPESDDSKIAA